MVLAINGWMMKMIFKRHSTKSILYETLRQFACCVAVCFVLTVPLFYLLTKCFYAEDVMDVIEAFERGEGVPHTDLEQDIIAGMMLQFLLIFVVITMSLFITLRMAARKLWAPFDDTLRKAENFSLADNDVPRFCQTNIKEFIRLNNSLTKLMTNDKNAYRVQKEFTENASHELQTPLAIIQSKLDLLLQERMTENQTNIVGELYGLTKRMSRLNRNLLLLARIENAQYTRMEDLDIGTIIASSLQTYEALWEGHPICWLDQRNSDKKTIRANPVLLDCLLKNLIVNAMRHSLLESEVCVTLTENTLSVSNEAADGKALDAENLFTRFHTEHTVTAGNGLGLAIVKAICEFHRWDITYCYEGGKHHFVVSFHPQEKK